MLERIHVAVAVVEVVDVAAVVAVHVQVGFEMEKMNSSFFQFLLLQMALVERIH